MSRNISFATTVVTGAAAVAAVAVVAGLWWRRGASSRSASSATPPPVVVVKLGGSAVTVKDKLETANTELLERCCDQLAEVHASSVSCGGDGPALLVAHGAGSFGHFQAKEYKLSKGRDLHPEWRRGLAECRRAVTQLNHLVVDALVRRGVPAVGVPLFPQARTEGGGRERVVRWGDMDEIEQLLGMGLVPVVHGDVVLDVKQGISILSGDTILQRFAEELGEHRLKGAVFLTDVAGVFDRPPSQKGASLLRTIGIQRDGTYQLPEVDVASHDVTGGIATKIAAAVAVAKAGTPVDIVRVASPSALAAIRVQLPRPDGYEGTRVSKV